MTRSLVTRRQVLTGFLSASALALTATSGRARTPKPASAPRKLVHIFLAGGMDDLYTIDPKQRNDVRAGIGPTYRADELVSGGAVTVGPNWSALRGHLHRMHVITGVQQNTVAHAAGTLQVQQLRLDVSSEEDPTAMTIAGSILAPDAPIHTLHLGFEEMLSMQPRGRCIADDKGAPLLTRLHAIANREDQRDRTLAALADSIASCGMTDCDPYIAVKGLIERMRGSKPPSATALKVDINEWPEPYNRFAQGLEDLEQMNFEWVLFALANDLAPTVFVTSAYPWDSHVTNHGLQTAFGRHFAIRLANFLDRLDTTRGRDGRPLSEQVGIIISSELGRFPYVNAQGGKDHFPQLSTILLGPGIRPGRSGHTGPELVGDKVSLRTGAPAASGTQLTLDDIGRTVFEWIGMRDPAGAGFNGRVLESCLA